MESEEKRGGEYIARNTAAAQEVTLSAHTLIKLDPDSAYHSPLTFTVASFENMLTVSSSISHFAFPQ